MKHIIALLLVCAGLGIDANGNQNMEIVLSLCFLFGSLALAKPAIGFLSSTTAALIPFKVPAGMKRFMH